MGKPYLIHDTHRPGVQVAMRVREKLEHQAVANEVCRMQSDRLIKLQKLIGALVGRLGPPPEHEPEQTLVKASGPRGIGDAQPDMIENGSATGHPKRPPSHRETPKL